MNVKSKLIIALTLLTLTTIFALQNAAAVKVRFLFWSLSSSLALLIVVLLSLGLLAGWLLGSLTHRPSKSNPS